MSRSHAQGIELQQRYFSETANQYDDLHCHDDNEQIFCSAGYTGFMHYLGVKP